ncbi:MAG: glycosyl hydrolase [Thermoguttaceae bacterium]
MSMHKVIQLLLIGLLLGTLQSWETSAVVAAEGGPGENADVEIGGPGDGPGQFLELLDIAFGPDNRLYTLEGRRRDNESKRWVGGCRVQVFDNDGTYLEQFPVEADGLSDEKTPARLAVSDDGCVFVSEPVTGVVLQYRRGDRWELSRQYTIPDAFAIAPWNVRGKQHIAVLANRREHNQPVPCDRIELIDVQAGKLAEPLVLSRPVSEVMDTTPDGRGNLCVVAAVNQLYRYNAAGKLTAAVGSGAWRRVGDGSELRHSVAIDSQGRIYSQAWGKIARFEPDLKSVALENGQFYWYDNWSPHDGYTPMAIDKDDRLWIGATGNTPLDVRHHYRPCVSRVNDDFFEKAMPQSTLALGFDPTITTDLPYNVAYDLTPIELEFVVPKAFRQVRDVVVDYRVYDVYKSEAARGSFSLKLENDVETRQGFPFTPPRFGWYTVECHATTGGHPVLSVGAHLGVTPKVEGLPQLAEGDSPGGWIDPVKQAFCGLRLMRLHTNQGEEAIAKTLAAAEKVGLTVVVQFQDKKDCQAETVRRFVTKFKGRVKYWEIINEPNFSMSPQEYAKLVAEVTAVIKGIDPAARVMGPAVCGINLDWHRQTFQAGAGKHFDILSIHDYEGNEAVDPGHWRWKLAQLRELMSKHGVGDKPIWQTERAIGGVRADNFLGGVQAVRVTLQRDVMETLGVPNEHNLHYYLNQAGYGSVPTYVWSESGPHPVALALRTREAMVRGRRYAGTLDFGPNGNKIFLGLQYEGSDGSTVVLRQYGAATEPSIELGVRGTATLEVVDSFGNRRKVPVRDGKVTLKVPLLPIYLRLERGQELVPPRIDFGRNLARDATIAYSGKTESDPSVLTNGVFEVTHAGSPWGPYWVGDLSRMPQTLDITLSRPRPVDRLIVYSMRADNPHCYLVDFDVQHHDGRQWVTLSEVRTPIPPSDLVRTTQSKANTWYLDQNFAMVEFPTVTTDRLRIVARRSTLGFQPDWAAVKATGWQAGGPNLHLREIEVYGPPPAAALPRPMDLNSSLDHISSDTRALVILDSRLCKLIAPDLLAYTRAAAARRKFPITVLPIVGLDDYRPPEVRRALQSWQAARPELEGVLFVGNVKLPSFFLPRADTPSTRLWPRLFEDLDMSAERRIAPGTILKSCGPGQPWPCVAGVEEFKTPEHDFDHFDQGPSHGPELWAAFLPVGYQDETKNTYDGWAKQLTPFFKKAIAFYDGTTTYGRGLYLVSNDLSCLARSEPVCSAVGLREIEFYSVNEKGPGAFKDNPAGYVRANLASYASLDAFLTHAGKLPWMDEGWQSPEIFLSHMRQSRRRFVWWNVHSNPEVSLISNEQAGSMAGGGLIALLNGCSVGGFRQPDSRSHVDLQTAPEDNVLVSLVYGQSAFLAALGSPHNRVNDETATPLFAHIYSGGYLGMAHRLRLSQQDKDSPNPGVLRGRQEMLIGDPFLDAR